MPDTEFTHPSVLAPDLIQARLAGIRVLLPAFGLGLAGAMWGKSS